MEVVTERAESLLGGTRGVQDRYVRAVDLERLSARCFTDVENAQSSAFEMSAHFVPRKGVEVYS